MPPVRNEKMMHTAPSAPSVPATVAAVVPSRLKPRKPCPCAISVMIGTTHADEEVGDADTQQRPHRAAELHLPLMQHRAIDAPRQHRSRDER